MAGLDLYGLVNNAGYGVTGAVEDVGDDEARALFETMVHRADAAGPARAAVDASANGGGRIVNISSIAGLATMPFAGSLHRARSTRSRRCPTRCASRSPATA